MSILPRTQRGFHIAVLLILIAGAVVAITPMVYMVSTALKPAAYVPEFPPQFIPDNPTLENFRTAFTSRNFDTAFFNSAKVAIATSFVVTALASMMASTGRDSAAQPA